jgi:tripartite-type tricarboxylate transporter receptor subunit TctC
MNLARREILSLSIGAAAWPMVLRPATADAPAPGPLHVVVGFAPGGIEDFAARLIGQSLQQRLGQSVVVDDRPGAGGNVGTEAVVDARPDGGTLILASSKNAINATLYDKLPFDFIGEIAMGPASCKPRSSC